MSALKIVVLVEVLALVAMITLAALHKFDIAPFKIAFGGFAIALLVLVAGALMCLVSLVIFSFYGQHDTPWMIKVLGVAIGLAPLFLIVLVIGKDGFSKPRIHDISTNPDLKLSFKVIPGLRKASDNTLSFPSNDVVRKQRAGYPSIKPISFRDPADKVFKQALDVAKDLGWQIVATDEDELRFEAVDETAFFGFKDDIVVAVSTKNADLHGEAGSEKNSVVNLRSVSRVGVSDLGANADRIQRFLERLNASLENG